MAKKIQQIVVTDTTPAADEMGLVVRPIGGSGGGDVTIVDPIGQKPMAESVSVVIASDQSPIEVTFTPSAEQDVNLTEVGGVAVTLGQKISADSIPIVLASDQSPINVNINDGSGNDLSSGISPPSTNERGLFTRSIPIINSASAIFNSLDDILDIETFGVGEATFILTPTAAIDGTITFFASYDNAASYVPTLAYEFRVGSFQELSSNVITGATQHKYLIGPPFGGVTHVRLKLSAFSSGSASVFAIVQNTPLDPVYAVAGPGNSTPAAWPGGAIAIGAGLSTDFSKMVGLTAVQTQANINPNQFGLLIQAGASHVDFGVKIRNAVNIFINPLTDTELRAAPVPVSGTVSVTEPVTVDAVDFDVRNLVFATDKVDTTGSSVNIEGGVSAALLEVDAATLAARIQVRPTDVGALGSYIITAGSGTIAAGLAAGATIFSARWGDATRAMVVHRIAISANTLATAFTAGATSLALYQARAFTVSDSGGLPVVLTANNGKRRTSFGTSLVTDMRISNAGALTAGTRALDFTLPGFTQGRVPATAVNYPFCGENLYCIPGASTGAFTVKPFELFNQNTGGWPLVFVQNEGFVIRASVPATGTWAIVVVVEWSEVLLTAGYN